MSRIKI